MIACRHSNLKLVDLLINHSPGLIFVSEDQNSLSPLHVSTSRGDKGIVQSMLDAVQGLYEKGITHRDLNLTDKIGRTPFYNACYHGQLPIVKAFLEFKAKFPDKIDINAEEKSRRSPLHAAVSAPKFSKEIVELLVKEEELKLNIEAYPSSRSHKYIAKMLERKRSLTVFPSPSISHSYNRTYTSFDQIESDDPPSYRDDRGCDTPISTSSAISDDLDAEIGITKRDSLPHTPISPLMHSVALPSPTASIPAPSSQVRIICSNNGRLEAIEGSGESHTPFSKLLLTPLAEACVFNSQDIVEILINHGAKDLSGYGCQIAYLIHQPSLVNLILSYQCKLCEQIEDKPHPHPLYTLDWKEKHLRIVKGEWLFSDLYSLDLDLSPFLGCQLLTFNRLEPASIHIVHLQKNCLQTLPIQLFQLPNVTEINVAENSLTSLPDIESDSCTVSIGTNAWKCSQLTVLILSSNNLSCLPTCLWFLPSLEILKASMNKLESLVPLPEAFNSLIKRDESIDLAPNLREIDVSKNSLKEIDNFVFCLSELSKLNLSQNELQSLPDSLWDCVTLHHLDVSSNSLSSLPRCGGPDDIREAALAKSTPGILHMATTLTAPQGVFQNDLDSRESLHVSRRRRSKSSRSRMKKKGDDFKIHKLKEEIDSGEGGDVVIEMCDYSVLTRLNLSKNRFKSFPIGLPCLAPNLCELDISDNNIQVIDIIFLPQILRKLSAKRCSLEKFGNTLTEGQLSSMRRNCYYELDSNVCLHCSHSQLLYLQTLMLESNKLKRFQLLKAVLKRTTKDPTEDEIEFRQNCSALNLLYPSMEGLDLTNNSLTGTFNPNIGRQTQLKWLWLSQNKELEKLPLHVADLKNFRRLTEIKLRNLPNLVEPPKEYQNESVQASQLLTYMRSRLKE